MPSADKLTIETPEQTSLEFPLAGIGSRFLAVAIDTLLQTAALLVLATLGGLIAYAGLLKDVGKQWAIAILLLVFFLVQLGYFSFFEAAWNGQTPGKRWTDLRVMRDSGQPISVQDAILRNLLRIVDSLPTLYAAGIITILISPQNKRIGDYVAGTVVVHEKPLQGAAAVWATSAAQPLAAGRLPVLTVEELHLVETFLERRGSFEPGVRWSMARQIAQRLGERWSVPSEARPDAEKFLEALAEQRRNTARFR